MAQFNVDRIWLLWTAAQEAILGLEPENESVPLDPGLYFVVGHSPDLPIGGKASGEERLYAQSTILGVFSSDFPRVAFNWSNPVDVLEIMQLKGRTVSPVITFRLESDSEIKGEDGIAVDEKGAGFVILSSPLNDEYQNAGRDAILSYSSFWGNERDANPVFSDALWAARYDIARPNTGAEGDLQVVSIGHSSRIHPGGGPSFILKKSSIPSQVKIGKDYDGPQFIEKFRNNRYQFLELTIVPPDSGYGPFKMEDFEGLRLMRIPRVGLQFNQWKQNGQIAVGEVSEILNELLADFLCRAWQMQIDGGNVVNQNSNALAAIAQKSLSGLDSNGQLIEIRLSEIPNEFGTTAFDPESGRLHLALLAAGDHLVIADEQQRQFKFADSLSQTIVAFEATDSGLRLVSSKYSLNSKEIARITARIKTATTLRSGNSSISLPDPLGLWITQNNGPQNMDGVAPGSFAIATAMGLSPSIQQKVDLSWDEYSNDPAALLLAKILCPDLIQKGHASIHRDFPLLFRALSFVGLPFEKSDKLEIEDELAAIDFLWRLSDDDRDAFQTMVRVQAPIKFGEAGEADNLKQNIERVRNVRLAASKIDQSASSLNRDCRSLLETGRVLPSEIDNFEEALYILEQLIGLEREFETGNSVDGIETIGSIRDLEELKRVFNEHMSALENPETRNDVANYRKFFERNQKYPGLLEQQLSRIENKHSDVLEPAIDKNLKELLRRLLDQLGNPEEANLKALSDNRRSPDKVNSGWLDWQSVLGSSKGFEKASSELKNTTTVLAVTAEASRMYCECENILSVARDSKIIPPVNLFRRLRIWPQDLELTYSDFKEFEKDHLGSPNRRQGASS